MHPEGFCAQKTETSDVRIIDICCILNEDDVLFIYGRIRGPGRCDILRALIPITRLIRPMREMMSAHPDRLQYGSNVYLSRRLTVTLLVFPEFDSKKGGEDGQVQ
jgi:hypothetical protein